MDEGSLGLGLEERKKNGDPTGWYNYVVGGSIPPVPARAVKKTKRNERRRGGREEKRREEKRREEKRREEKRRGTKKVCISRKSVFFIPECLLHFFLTKYPSQLHELSATRFSPLPSPPPSLPLTMIFLVSHNSIFHLSKSCSALCKS